MTAIDYAARVAKGVELLDAKMPGWEDRIDLETLDIGSGVECVAAQLSGMGNWHRGAQMLGLGRQAQETAGDRLIPFGLNAEPACACSWPNGVPEGYTLEAAYATLNELWRGVITERRKVPA